MKDELQPLPGREDNQQPAEGESAPVSRRQRRLRGYLATGTDISGRNAQRPPPADPRDLDKDENRQDGPEGVGTEASPGGTA